MKKNEKNINPIFLRVVVLGGGGGGGRGGLKKGLKTTQTNKGEVKQTPMSMIQSMKKKSHRPRPY